MALADISLLSLGRITSNVNETLQFLRTHNLCKDSKFCASCQIFMSYLRAVSRVDQYIWRCPSCQKTSQLRDDSFLIGQRLPRSLHIYILYLFSSNVSAETASKLLVGEIHINSIHTWYNLYRDIMSRSLLQTPVQLGGVY